MTTRAKVCRICMTGTTKGVISLFSVCNGSIRIYDKVMEVANVQISEEDGLPVWICYSCLVHLETSYQFKIQAEKSDQLFRNQLEASMAKNKPMSNEERLKRKREYEKKRREQIKQDSEKLKALKEKKHTIYLKAKEKRRVKMIKECNPREQRVIRKHCKENTKKRRDRLKAVAKTDALCRNNTPPLRSDEEQQEVQQELCNPREQRVIRKHWKENTKKRRDRLKAVAKTDALCGNNTPPLRSDEEQQEVQQELILSERGNER